MKKWMSAITMASLCLVISIASAANGVDSETRLPTKIIQSPTLDSIGGDPIEVFFSIATSDGNPRLYYTYPFFKPEFDKFRKNVNLVCAAANANAVKVAGLPVTFWSNGYREELAAKLSTELNAKVTPASVFVYPHYQITVRVVADGKSRILEKFPADPMDPAASMPNRITLGYTADVVNIKASCNELAEIATNPQSVKADMYAMNDTATLDMVSLKYGAVLNNLSSTDASIDSSATGGVVVSTRSQGKYGRSGISLLGPFSAAVGATNTTGSVSSTDTRKRYVSQSYVNSVARKAATNFQISSVVESTSFSVPDVSERLMKFVLDNSTTHVASFQKEADGQWKMVVDGANYALGKDSVDMLMSGKPGTKTVQDNESDTAVEYEGVKAAEKKKENSEFETNDEITWKHNGTDWVPVTAKLRSFTLSSLRNKTQATESVVRVARQTKLLAVELRAIAQVGTEWRTWAQRTGKLEQQFLSQGDAFKVDQRNLADLNAKVLDLSTKIDGRLAPLETRLAAAKEQERLAEECRRRGARYSWNGNTCHYGGGR